MRWKKTLALLLGTAWGLPSGNVNNDGGGTIDAAEIQANAVCDDDVTHHQAALAASRPLLLAAAHPARGLPGTADGHVRDK